MVNDEWKDMYPASLVVYLEAIESDYRPGVIKIRHKHDTDSKLFRFDSRLCEVPEIEDIISEEWTNTNNGVSQSITEKLKSCRRAISKWKRENSTNSAKMIKELTEMIDVAHTDGVTSTKRLQELRKELLHAHIQEEKYWKTKSRIQWLKAGDLNTKFFHAATKNRTAKNRISHIIGASGDDIYGNQDIAR